MTLFLRERAGALEELMDDPACDPVLLARTYAQFTAINRLFSHWASLYRAQIRPLLAAGATRILDLGCGGGDVIRQLAGFAAHDGFAVHFTGADPDPRAIAFAQAQPPPANITFIATDARTLAAAGETFDIVLSNHVLHHLNDEAVRALCQDCQQLARRRVLHNDLCRSDLAFALFPWMGLVFHRSFIVADGLRSIRRAFTPAELAALCPPGWRVTTPTPFRLLLTWEA